MEENLKEKAKNYFILGAIAESLNMNAESASNFFKALFAIDDFDLLKFGDKPKDHTERFNMLKIKSPKLYLLTDRLFSTYRRTYTQELRKEELQLVKERVKEAFENAGIEIPADKEVREKLAEIIKKGKILG